MGVVCPPMLIQTAALKRLEAVAVVVGLVRYDRCNRMSLDSWYACHGKQVAGVPRWKKWVQEYGSKVTLEYRVHEICIPMARSRTRQPSRPDENNFDLGASGDARTVAEALGRNDSRFRHRKAGLSGQAR